jgi:hypothetical protein
MHEASHDDCNTKQNRSNRKSNTLLLGQGHAGVPNIQ